MFFPSRVQALEFQTFEKKNLGCFLKVLGLQLEQGNQGQARVISSYQNGGRKS